MKLKALKNFRVKDSVREKMVTQLKGELFEMDEDKQGQEIYLLLQVGQASVVDDAYIPQQGNYLGIHVLSEQREDGTWLRVNPNKVVALSQAEGSRLMVMGYVKPESDSAWRPSWLIEGSVSSKPPKPMFDEPKENWAVSYRIKGGHE